MGERLSARPIEPLRRPSVMSVLEVGGEPLDLPCRQGRQTSPYRKQLAIALGGPKATSPVDRAPERSMFAPFGSEPKLERPLQGIDVEAGRVGFHSGRQSAQEER